MQKQSGYTMSRLITLTNGKVAIVDDKDYIYLSRFNWVDNNGHPSRNVNKRSLLMADFIMQRTRGRFRYYFKNGNTYDLRKKNIELLTFSQVGILLPKCSKICSSVYKGVFWDKRRKKWVAYIYSPSETVNNKRIRKHYYLGTFENEWLAAVAYNKKVVELYGNKAYQNKKETND